VSLTSEKMWGTCAFDLARRERKNVEDREERGALTDVRKKRSRKQSLGRGALGGRRKALEEGNCRSDGKEVGSLGEQEFEFLALLLPLQGGRSSHFLGARGHDSLIWGLRGEDEHLPCSGRRHQKKKRTLPFTFPSAKEPAPKGDEESDIRARESEKGCIILLREGSGKSVL